MLHDSHIDYDNRSRFSKFEFILELILWKCKKIVTNYAIEIAVINRMKRINRNKIKLKKKIICSSVIVSINSKSFRYLICSNFINFQHFQKKFYTQIIVKDIRNVTLFNHPSTFIRTTKFCLNFFLF